MKYSRQRELIKAFLQGRKDHPTADAIYMNLKETEPNISLATVYRNLTLLSEMGEIQRLELGGGGDHFDGEPGVHDHFICKECGCVLDLDAKDISREISSAVEGFEGKIDGHVIYYYGQCPKCCLTHLV